MAEDTEGRVYIEPLNNDHRTNIGIALGLAAAINLLNGEAEKFGKLPGFNTAIALIEAVEARHRADVAGANFRAVANAGHDIVTNMVGLIGRGQIYVQPMDLEDRATFAPDGEG